MVPSYGVLAAPAYGLTVAYGLYRAAAPETSVRDKYAKYGTSSTTSYRPASNLRSVRYIRRSISKICSRYMWCLGVSGVWLEPNSFISAPATTAYSMGDTTSSLRQRNNPRPKAPSWRRDKMRQQPEFHFGVLNTLESRAQFGTSKPVLKRKSADETDKKTVSSDATPATPANSVSSSNNQRN